MLIRNSKSEARNSKQIRIANDKNSKQKKGLLLNTSVDNTTLFKFGALINLNFDIVSYFELRASNFMPLLQDVTDNNECLNYEAGAV